MNNPFLNQVYIKPEETPSEGVLLNNPFLNKAALPENLKVKSEAEKDLDLNVIRKWVNKYPHTSVSLMVRFISGHYLLNKF